MWIQENPTPFYLKIFKYKLWPNPKKIVKFQLDSQNSSMSDHTLSRTTSETHHIEEKWENKKLYLIKSHGIPLKIQRRLVQ